MRQRVPLSLGKTQEERTVLLRPAGVPLEVPQQNHPPPTDTAQPFGGSGQSECSGLIQFRFQFVSKDFTLLGGRVFFPSWSWYAMALVPLVEIVIHAGVVEV